MGPAVRVHGTRGSDRDPRYLTDDHRWSGRDEIVAIIEEWLQTLPDDEAALLVLAEARISSGPVLSQEDIWRHPHYNARGVPGD